MIILKKNGDQISREEFRILNRRAWRVTNVAMDQIKNRMSEPKGYIVFMIVYIYKILKIKLSLIY